MTTNRYWFRARYFGRGWYPETWEGWTVSLIYCVAVVAAYFLLSDSSGLFCVVILTVVFLSVCKAKGKAPQAKTDGKEKVWRAGKIG